MFFGMLGWVLAGAAFYIMYAFKFNRGRFIDSQGKMAALLMVILVVGIMLLMGSYNRIQVLIWKPVIVNDPKPGSIQGSSIPVHSGHPDTQMQAPAQIPKVTAPQPPAVHHDDVPLGVTPSHAPTNKAFYGIIFDAGSTGTRIHCFTFLHRAAGQPIELKDEYFEEVKPGLSSFADKPADAMAGVRKMLDKCRDIIPEASWKETPIALKATAGLRLLPQEKADALLLEVQNTFKSYPFDMGPNAVSIMDGNDEGVFSWFTVNYLLGNMVDPKRTITVMDLGGGSTQATFLPQQMVSLQSANAADLQDVDIGGKKSKLWTHSYLGLGLMSGRLQTLGGKEGEDSKNNPNEFSSPCFPAGYRTYWAHGGKNYSIVGAQNVGNRADNCYAAAQRVIQNQISVPAELSGGNIMLISYYFDRAAEAKLINATEGGDLKVSNYIAAAQTACSSPVGENSFLCLDLSYISALLRDGFKLGPDHMLTIRKRVEDREISWALGAMFKLLKSPKPQAQGG